MFAFPKIHSFPPFFTKQQNSTVLESQLNEWCSLILAYSEHYRAFTLLPQGSILSLQSHFEATALFENRDIERSASSEFRRDIFNHLIHKLERAAYVDAKQQDAGILVFWRTAEEWARMLYTHIDKTGRLGSVLTVYELTLPDELSVDEEFRNLDYNMLVRVVQVLVKQNKAQVLRAEDGLGKLEGVKIV